MSKGSREFKKFWKCYNVEFIFGGESNSFVKSKHYQSLKSYKAFKREHQRYRKNIKKLSRIFNSVHHTSMNNHWKEKYKEYMS